MSAAHLPYLLWLLLESPGGGVAQIRSVGILAAAALLAWTKRHEEQAETALGPGVPLLLGSSWVIALAGLHNNQWWALSSSLGCSGIVLFRYGRQGLNRHVLILLMIMVAYPLERHLGLRADHLMQWITATCAAPLVTLSGLPVEVVWGEGDPILAGDRLLVTVTALCAGTQTFIALFSLGLVLAEIFVPHLGGKLLFVLLTPLIGFGANVLRIALSAHAIKAWGGQSMAWTIAHDAIGYLTFALTYVFLIMLARRWGGAPVAPAQTSPERPQRRVET